jgi:uncharacterized protein YbjQ (UPF0145 family)
MRGGMIVLGMVAAVALPVSAQRVAAEIALAESATPAGAIVLGEVSAEIHQRALFAKTPARDLADKELRAQAAKLGADAVVDIRYEDNSPLFSKKGFRAIGKAVKFAPVQVAAAAPPSPAAPEAGRTATLAPAEPAAALPGPLVPAVVTSAPSPLAAPAPQIATVSPAPVVSDPPQTASVVLSPPQAAVVAAPVVAPPSQIAEVAPPPVPVAQPAPVAAAAVPAAPRGPTPEALIVLTEEDLVGRAYERLGEVRAEARQASLFPKKPARVMMDEQLRAKAAALGADAVILIKYELYSPLLSKKGASAVGMAVKHQ